MGCCREPWRVLKQAAGYVEKNKHPQGQKGKFTPTKAKKEEEDKTLPRRGRHDKDKRDVQRLQVGVVEEKPGSWAQVR